MARLAFSTHRDSVTEGKSPCGPRRASEAPQQGVCRPPRHGPFIRSPSARRRKDPTTRRLSLWARRQLDSGWRLRARVRCFTKPVAKRRKGTWGTLDERVVHGRTVAWRVAWACPACQSAENQRATDLRRLGRRLRHKGPWLTESAARAQRQEIAAYYRDGDGTSCWVADQHDEAVGDAAMFGPLVETYADRVLGRRSGAESTRADDQRLWHEDAGTDEHGYPLGLGERYGHRPIGQVTSDDVRAWLRATEARPGRAAGSTLSASQVRQRYYLLARVLREAQRDGGLVSDPLLGLDPPPLPHGRAVTGLMRADEDARFLPTLDQTQKLVAATDERTRLAAVLAFAAGLRVGEVTALERRDLRQVGPQRWTVSITRSESQRGGGRQRSATKNRQAHVRHLPVWAGAEVEAHLARVGALAPTDRLLPAIGRRPAVGVSATCIRKHLHAACGAVDLPLIGMHDLRAAGEREVAERIGRPAAASWARHGLGVQMRHYVAVETERDSLHAAGWDE